jgi:hypothetical protein
MAFNGISYSQDAAAAGAATYRGVLEAPSRGRGSCAALAPNGACGLLEKDVKWWNADARKLSIETRVEIRGSSAKRGKGCI